MKFNKSVVIVIITLVMVGFISIPINALDNNISYESLMNKNSEEIKNLLFERGLVLPESYKKRPETLDSAIDIALKTINAGYTRELALPFNNKFLIDLTHKIMDLLEPVDYNSDIDKFALRYGRLRDSETVGSWHNSYYNYNCYAYALGYGRWLHVGDYSNQNWYDGDSVYRTANIVVDDLKEMGYTAYYTENIDNEIYDRARLIALRVADNDYHFMGDTWYKREWQHKPGDSHILRWNWSSPDYKIWSNEAIRNGEYYSPTVYYDSRVLYIYYWPKDEGPSPYKLQQLLKKIETNR